MVPVESLANFRVGTISVGPGPEFWVSYRALAPFSRIYLSNGRWKRQDFDAASGYGPNETRYLLRDRRGGSGAEPPKVSTFPMECISLRRTGSGSPPFTICRTIPSALSV